MVGWLLLSLLGSLVPAFVGRKVLKRALPLDERVDIQEVGGRAQWSQVRMSALSGPIGIFVRGVLAEPLKSDQVDLVCQRLAEVDVETGHVTERMAMLARCSLAIGGAIFVLGVSRAVRLQNGWMVACGVIPLGLGGLSAFWCWWMGQRAKSAIGDRRRTWDWLSRLLLQSTTSEQRADGDHPTPWIHDENSLDFGSSDECSGNGENRARCLERGVFRTNLTVG